MTGVRWAVLSRGTFSFPAAFCPEALLTVLCLPRGDSWWLWAC